MTVRCTFAHVDLHALQFNFRSISDFLASNVSVGPLNSPGKLPGVIAVVKANAYGHVTLLVHNPVAAPRLQSASIADARDFASRIEAIVKEGMTTIGDRQSADGGRQHV